jgi:hypothetical protein
MRLPVAKNPEIQVVGVAPTEGAEIPGIKAWTKDMPYLPRIYDFDMIDKMVYVLPPFVQKSKDLIICLGED